MAGGATPPYWLYLEIATSWFGIAKYFSTPLSWIQWRFCKTNLIGCQIKPKWQMLWQMLYQFTIFCCILQLFLIKYANFCSENRITLKDCVSVTCDNQFFVNFELNWWKEVSDRHFESLYHPPVSGVKFHWERVPNC